MSAGKFIDEGYGGLHSERMSAGKHTPGPWAIHPVSAHIVPAAHVDRPTGAAAHSDFDFAHYAQEICALHWPDRHRLESEVRANARLIAAAPETADKAMAFTLLVERFIRADESRPPSEEELTGAMYALRAHIAKATGEQA